ncbi:MAG: AAA family ATPase [Planctomycetota bacterium]|nr:AAA family ATPase [Planctomycetota bacterium]
MSHRKRLYDAMLAEHLERHRQMAFVVGPRQVGKTTACRSLSSAYLNWDNADDRQILLQGPAATAARLGLERLRETPPVGTFDELHKFRKWKSFLKGFYDTYADSVRVLVTGSSRLDVYRRGGDSLMGRYFLYRMHPFSVAEVIHPGLPDPKKIVRPPHRIAEADFAALWHHGGYPEPFLKRQDRFTRRWSGLRRHQLLREDVRDLTRIHELGQIETLVGLLAERSGDQLVYSGLAGQVQVSQDTLRRWLETLCGMYLGFLVRPWFQNVSKSLRKEPKWFLRDWSGIADEGKRTETFIACHLLKAVEGWTDLGLGEFQLGYLRDRLKREVDFVIIRDRKPWMLVEAKKADEKLGASLAYFQEQTKAPLAFQVVLDADYVDADCFARPGGPQVVPARTFLSQLL